MTLVTKNIRGQGYYYYQDSVKTDGKSKVVNTFIARTDAEGKILLESKQQALVKHLIKILKAAYVIGKKHYNFETMKTNDDDLLNDSLDYLRLVYQSYRRVLSPSELDEFDNVIFTKYVHGTTAIEGNTLSEEEAFRLLSADLTPPNKSINEALEVANYNNVKNYIKTYAGNVTEKMIKRIHQLLMNGIHGRNGKLINAGEYRDGQVILRNIGFRPPPADIVPSQMKYLLEEYYSQQKENIHPLEIATTFHQKFEEIHPFQDGNGRVGREILNYMLTSDGFPPIYILEKEQSVYLSALQEGNKRDHIPLFSFVISRIGGSLAYLMTRTNLYSTIISDEARIVAKELGADDVYHEFLSIAKKQHDDIELP